jgi:hypothetical protein
LPLHPDKVPDPFAATVAMATTVSMHEAPEPVLNYGDRRKSGTVAVAVAIAVHALLLWLLINKNFVIEQLKVKGGEAITYVSPLDQNKPRPKPAATRPPPPKSVRRPQVPVNAPRQVLVQSQRETITAQSIDTPPAPAKVEEPMDMMAQLEAKRRLRAEQAPQATEGSGESEAARANRIARANIAAAVGKGQDKEDTGGMFQIRNQTFNSADISFRGWNSNFKRNWSQLVRVEQGGEPDIETAVVKKMIDIIRQYKQEDFVWESHRLNRNITLSARQRDTSELQAFLLKEFYPDYKRANGTGRG